MVEQLTSLGIQMQSSRLIQSGASTLATLASQLTSGKKSENLNDYNTTDARRMLDLRNVVTKRESYISAIDAVKPRLDAYDKTLEGMSKITTQVQRLINEANTPELATSGAIESQIEGYMTQLEAYLNQKVGDRYIYSGSRYTTVPAGDIESLPLPPAETYPVTSPTLPPWDTQRIAGTTTNAAGWAQLSTTVDDGFSVTYGVRSTEEGIQELVQGLRWALAAVRNPTNYNTYMTNARTELTNAQVNIRELQSAVATNSNTLEETKRLHQKLISDAKQSVQDIQYVDINEVATKVTFYQTQLQASYSVTANIASLSILSYLR
jgi:flagellin-like hook-associated protein FlgL